MRHLEHRLNDFKGDFQCALCRMPPENPHRLRRPNGRESILTGQPEQPYCEPSMETVATIFTWDVCSL